MPGYDRSAGAPPPNAPRMIGPAALIVRDGPLLPEGDVRFVRLEHIGPVPLFPPQRPVIDAFPGGSAPTVVA